MLRPTLGRAIALALSLSSPLVAQNPAFAQDASSSDTTSQGSASQELDRVVVTGTRTAITVDDSLAAVEVVDRAEIERTQAHWEQACWGHVGFPQHERQPADASTSGVLIGPRASCALGFMSAQGCARSNDHDRAKPQLGRHLHEP